MRTAICMPKRNFKSQDDAEVFFAKGRHDIPWYFPSAWPDWSSMRLDCQKVPWEYIPVDPAKPRNMDPKFESSKVRKFHLIRFMIRCGSWRVLRRLCHEISKWRGLKQWKQSDVLRCSTFTAELTTWIGKGFPRFPDIGCPNRRELYYRYTVVSLSRSLSVSTYPENDARAAAHVETQGIFTCEGWRRRRFRSAFPKSWFPWPVAFAPLPRWSQPPESKIWGKRQRWNNEMWQNLLRLEWWNENIHQGVTRLQGAARSICINT